MKEKNDAVEYDILFLHPPSGFNKSRDPLSGVFPSELGESDLFLCAPFGINALYHRLKGRGFNPGFLNVGRLLKQAIDKEQPFDVSRIMSNFPAKAFGIDLHWAVHTPGALDLAAAVKKVFPESFVFLGGFMATYYYREILKEYPFVDAVVLGEADEAIIPLAEVLGKNSSTPNLGNVCNLAYRSVKDGHISVNPVRTPGKLENVSFQNIEKGLSGGYIGIRGCSFDCSICGGSRSGYKNFFYRDHLLALEPRQLIKEIEHFEKNGLDNVFLMGDIRIMGEPYVDAFFTELGKKKIDIHLHQELFFPAEPEYLERWKKNTRMCSFILTLESIDPRVTQRIGREFTAGETWNLIKNCSRMKLPLGLFLEFPLPEQNADSIRASMDFVEQAVDYPHIDFAVEPIFYISPGSAIFENPGKWGYYNDFRTLKDFKENLGKPHWSQSIGYHTQWLSKEKFIDMIFYVAERVNRIRLKKNPVQAPLYLLSIENQEANRRLIEKMQTMESVSDESIRRWIKELFPPYLLKDNRLIKLRSPKNDTFPYTPFRCLSYLLVYVFKVSPHQLLKYFKKWFKDIRMFPHVISLEEFKEAAAPESIKEDMLGLISRFNVPIDPVFFDNLMDFEWTNEMAHRVKISKGIGENTVTDKFTSENYSQYKLILSKAVVLKAFKYDFDRVDWENFSSREVIPNAAYYLYSLQTGKRRVVPPHIWELLDLCDGKRNVKEIIKDLKRTQDEEIAVAMALGLLVDEGLLLPLN
jgi:radical SAM superfamily enzyme YgiQ (UPF0313 family)